MVHRDGRQAEILRAKPRPSTLSRGGYATGVDLVSTGARERQVSRQVRVRPARSDEPFDKLPGGRVGVVAVRAENGQRPNSVRIARPRDKARKVSRAVGQQVGKDDGVEVAKVRACLVKAQGAAGTGVNQQQRAVVSPNQVARRAAAIVEFLATGSERLDPDALVPAKRFVRLRNGAGCSQDADKNPTGVSSESNHCNCSRDLSAAFASASSGIRQSPRGDSATVPTLGPAGNVVRLNWASKKRRKKTRSQRMMSSPE